MKKITAKKASLTVEAALVLPMFLFGILFFLYFFQLLFLQDSIQSSITEAGKFISRYQKLSGEEELSAVAKEVILKQRFLTYLDEDSINVSCIVGGVHGISLSKSEILEKGDEIQITAIYQIRIPVPFFGEKTSLVRQKVRTRAFVGKEIEGLKETGGNGESGNSEEDFLVYIAENGTVYHVSENCTHLRLSISEVRKAELPSARNESGGKYKPCEKCIEKNGEEELFYIARDGDRYHLSLSCSGLKRTVSAVYHSIVKDKRKCTRCG